MDLPQPFRVQSHLGIASRRKGRALHALEVFPVDTGLQQLSLSLGRWDLDDLLGDEATFKAALEALAPQKYLRHLTIGDRNERPLLLNDVQPLALLSSLEALDLQIYGEVRMTDDDVGSFVSHFPALLYLTLIEHPYFGKNYIPSTTLRVLGIVADVCPRIEMIGISVNATDPRLPPDPPSSPSRTLRCIEIRSSPIDNAQAVGS